MGCNIKNAVNICKKISILDNIMKWDKRLRKCRVTTIKKQKNLLLNQQIFYYIRVKRS